MRIGILGGTYNPPHTGHLHAAVAARDALGLDRVILLPSFLPPHKTMPRHTPDAEARLAMTRLAAAEIGAEVSDLEIRRGGTSYTADTLAEFARLYQGDSLWFIMGTDMFLTVQNWVRPHEIFALSRIAVVLREDSDAARVKAHKSELETAFSCKVDLVDVKAHPISSTELRENVLDEEHQMYLPKSVLDYIKQHRFYLSEENENRA